MFARPPDPADPELFARLVRDWWGFCDRWAARQEAAHPGRDFGPAANLKLWQAAATFDPGGGFTFQAYLSRALWCAGRDVLKKGLPTVAVGVIREGDGPCVEARLPDDGPDLEAMLVPLRPKHAELIRLRFRGDLTLEDAGARLGVTKQRAKQIEAAAIAALKSQIGARPDGLHRPV